MRYRCSQCHEPAQPRPPIGAWAELAAMMNRLPNWSHTDGEPLCPVVEAAGYVPCQPEPDPDDEIPPYLLGVWVCAPCNLVLELLTDDDPKDQEFVTICPRCHRPGEFRANRSRETT